MIDPTLIPIAGIALPVVLVPIILGIRYARHEREMVHAERMKALELGRTLPGDESWWTLPRISVAIGVGVPAAVFACAWRASQTLGDSHDPWIAAGAVGLAAVVCGASLAAWHFARSERSSQAVASPYDKAPFDADAYDVVGRRG